VNSEDSALLLCPTADQTPLLMLLLLSCDKSVSLLSHGAKLACCPVAAERLLLLLLLLLLG